MRNIQIQLLTIGILICLWCFWQREQLTQGVALYRKTATQHIAFRTLQSPPAYCPDNDDITNFDALLDVIQNPYYKQRPVLNLELSPLNNIVAAFHIQKNRIILKLAQKYCGAIASAHVPVYEEHERLMYFYLHASAATGLSGPQADLDSLINQCLLTHDNNIFTDSMLPLRYDINRIYPSNAPNDDNDTVTQSTQDDYDDISMYSYSRDIALKYPLRSQSLIHIFGADSISLDLLRRDLKKSKELDDLCACWLPTAEYLQTRISNIAPPIKTNEFKQIALFCKYRDYVPLLKYY